MTPRRLHVPERLEQPEHLHAAFAKRFAARPGAAVVLSVYVTFAVSPPLLTVLWMQDRLGQHVSWERWVLVIVGIPLLLVFSVWLAEFVDRSKTRYLELTPRQLRCQKGRAIAWRSHIQRVTVLPEPGLAGTHRLTVYSRPLLSRQEVRTHLFVSDFRSARAFAEQLDPHTAFHSQVELTARQGREILSLETTRPLLRWLEFALAMLIMAASAPATIYLLGRFGNPGTYRFLREWCGPYGTILLGGALEIYWALIVLATTQWVVSIFPKPPDPADLGKPI